MASLAPPAEEIAPSSATPPAEQDNSGEEDWYKHEVGEFPEDTIVRISGLRTDLADILNGKEGVVRWSELPESSASWGRDGMPRVPVRIGGHIYLLSRCVLAVSAAAGTQVSAGARPPATGQIGEFWEGAAVKIALHPPS